jgi:hypothetical protein
MSRIARAIRVIVRERAAGRCEYCRIPDGYADFQHQVDHILPPRHLGTDALINLAYACFECNNAKGTDIATLDSETMSRIWLFNPRTQKWYDHFRIEKGYIVGQTAEGRATARLLEMNTPEQVRLRIQLQRMGRM